MIVLLLFRHPIESFLFTVVPLGRSRDTLKKLLVFHINQIISRLDFFLRLALGIEILLVSIPTSSKSGYTLLPDTFW